MIEKKLNEIFKQLIDDISDNKDGYIEFISEEKKDFSNKVIRTVKDNYKNFIKNILALQMVMMIQINFTQILQLNQTY